MSLFIMVDFSNETKQKLLEKQLILKQNCIGEWENSTAFHITVEFLSEELTQPNEAIRAMRSLDQLQYQKFEIIAKDFKNFDNNVYWMGVHNCFELYQIKYDVEKFLKQENFNLKPSKFKGYIPHITMGYNVEELKEFNKVCNGTKILVDNICLWHSYKINDSYVQDCLYRVDLK